MNTRRRDTDEVAELAALYVLGHADAGDCAWLEERLAAGDGEVRAEVDAARRTVAQWDAASVRPDEPSPSLRERILASARAEPRAVRDDDATQVWRRWSGRIGSQIAEGLDTVRDDDGSWETTAVEGVSVKPLFVDEARRVVTMLVRMDPGSSYPPHRHVGPEECLVLEGDLHVAGAVLGPGDYQRAEVHSHHGVQSTEGGCTLFITSSTEDELLAGAD